MEVQWSLEAAQQHRQARAYQWESAAARIHKTGDQRRYVYIYIYILIYIMKLVMQENLPRFTPQGFAPFRPRTSVPTITANAT